MRRVLFLLLLGQTVATSLVGQAAPDSLTTAADSAWLKQNWHLTAELYSRLVDRSASAPRPHFRLGVALLNLGRATEAKTQLEQAERLGAPPAQVAFRLAELRASLGDREGAFRELDRAAAAGLVSPPVPVESDRLLISLQHDPRLGAFVTALDRNAHPCHYNPHQKEFDFWVGDWDVRPRGQPDSPPAHNLIEKVQDGCVLLENWTGGSTGQSFNIYDPSFGKWNQTWVDNGGGLHIYWGGIVNGNMAYEGDMPETPPATGRVRTRLTFFPIAADTVRQFSESTRDGGKTWTVNYDLIYTRRKP